MDRELGTIALVLIAMVAGFAFLQPILPTNNQRYSELGILGPQKTIGGYPSNLLANQTFLLYLYIGNHEGAVGYYQVQVKLGNQSTVISNVTSAQAPLIYSYSYVLDDNQNATFPINLAINQTGINERIIFELWSYNETALDFSYTGLWNQLWVNVTGA